MTKLIIILFSILVFTDFYANHIPINLDNNGWSYTGWILDTVDYLPSSEDLYKCYFSGDTNINLYNYTKFYYDLIYYYTTEVGTRSQVVANKIYIGAIRKEELKYLYLPKDSANERLIYDFSLSSIGDTLPIGFYEFQQSDIYSTKYLIIKDSSTITMRDGSKRRKFQVKHVNSLGNFVHYDYLIEGMGYSTGIIPPFLFQTQVYSGGCDLQTYCEKGTLIWQTELVIFNPAENCDFTVGLITIKNNNIPVISPNPCIDGTLNVLINNNEDNLLMIYNTSGQLLIKQKLNTDSNSQQINLSHLSKGLYIVRITNNKGLVLSDKILIK